MDEVTLEEEQLEELNRGNSVTVTSYSITVDINPPCGGDHDWGRYNIKNSASILSRRCKICGEIDEVSVVFDEIFSMYREW